MTRQLLVSVNGSKPEPVGMVNIQDIGAIDDGTARHEYTNKIAPRDMADALSYALNIRGIFDTKGKDEDEWKPDEYIENIDRIIVNPPATIIFWKNGTKEIVKCMYGDCFSVEQGIAMCLFKKMLSEDGYRNLKKLMHKEDEKIFGNNVCEK